MSEKQAASALPPRVFWKLPRERTARTIAVLAPSYGLERLSYLIPSRKHSYVWLRSLPLHKLRIGANFLGRVPIVIGPHVDLVHTFNDLPLNRPFVVSAEMELPRLLGRTWAWQRRFALRRLASPACRGIWPLSDAAFAYIARRFDQAGMSGLREKMTVFRGALAGAAHDREGYTESGPLQLLFVGGDGLRKGLGPMLSAIERVRAAGVEIEVTVIGRPLAQTYIVPGASFDTAAVTEQLRQPWVRHHLSLPNPEVRRLMGTHDIFVFPTMDESLGWVPAEAALSGMPTITTDIFALPELVLDGESGWVIPVPLNEDRRWIHIGRADARGAWDAVQQHLTDAITRILLEVAADRSIVRRFGERAKAHISNLYDPAAAAARLEALYEAAIAGG